jgi:hypothetical protein
MIEAEKDSVPVSGELVSVPCSDLDTRVQWVWHNVGKKDVHVGGSCSGWIGSSGGHLARTAAMVSNAPGPCCSVEILTVSSSLVFGGRDSLPPFA